MEKYEIYLGELIAVKESVAEEFKKKALAIPYKQGTVAFALDYWTLWGDTIKILNDKLLTTANNILSSGRIPDHEQENAVDVLREHCIELIKKFSEENR